MLHSKHQKKNIVEKESAEIISNTQQYCLVIAGLILLYTLKLPPQVRSILPQTIATIKASGKDSYRKQIQSVTCCLIQKHELPNVKSPDNQSF